MSPVSSVTILYGSETGNAQDYAYYLARRLSYFSLNPTVSSLNDYPLKNLVTETRFLIVVCSTTGQGEVPRNGKKFLKFLLKKKLPHDLLNHVSMTSFGVGDSLYPKFNHAIKKLHTRLLQLGCSELCPRCESDEMSPEGVDGFYSEWVATLIPALCRHFPDLAQIDDHTLLPPTMPVEVSAGKPAVISETTNLSLTRTSPELKIGTLVSNRRVTAPGHFQDVRHLVIECDTADLTYVPGDTLALYPQNDTRSVQLLLELQPHWLEIADKPLHIAKPPALEGGLIGLEHLTLRSLITYHLDILSIPRRSFFAVLFHFVDGLTEMGQREREKLEEFTKLDESEELYNYANRPRRLILETIQEFQDNLKIPVEYVLDLFPLIKVRLFLIASRPSPKLVELIIGIVEYRTMLRRIRKGLCTKWIKGADVGEKLVFSIHKSNLKFQTPEDFLPPVLMVAPGTGIAPMKLLIEHTAGQQDLHLFYGFRDSTKDCLFSETWAELEKKGQLSLYYAISREAGFPHKYVQDRLFAEKDTVSRLLLKENAIFFLCGSSGKMPTQVRLTLVEILRPHVENPEQFLIDMENEGRYIQETW
ncbi:riboflavin synthase domain-like protein [Metschnikowia bicuspidata var. bicuspidata NRRL YB-4993]|uniref:NADPH-dependent diflavin oxidoreductase 1 n=1 Tax=Metschnikowia bicuspidata var. bicuspidata NRRL YB-4993 TaxID=869754 RepID=A0A1A0HHH1_9ASCO|nr:riboflavin synthase domain-like protein [Metschnikowia bicuspidata var. bicuspidata NRRL YB-4993]OBA23293.1 riboflavin synthase domain-like protein [Metschnikowia bicuspidata var. bicuspidata NRRL YB-4993]